MRFAVLATDYDGTLATRGAVTAETVAALDRLRASGRRLILVTGRALDELLAEFPEVDRFDRVVAENGALIYDPATGERRVLGDAPPEAFVQDLMRRGVPVSVGASIVATVEPHEQTVLASIRDFGLELQVIFNKGAVMVLPASVNKATGLKAALDDLGCSPRNTVAIGDAENDHALLRYAEFGVAVRNALPSLRAEADFPSELDHGEAVIELIDGMLANDLRTARPRRERRRLVLGTDQGDAEVAVAAAGAHVLIAASASDALRGVGAELLVRLHTEGYQFCVLDGTGAYAAMTDAVVLGVGADRPSVAEIVTALDRPDASVVANLSGVAPVHRAAYLAMLVPQLRAFRAATGRPHWLVVEPADALLSEGGIANGRALLEAFAGVIALTAHPGRVAPALAKAFDAVLALGTDAGQVLATLIGADTLAEAVGESRGMQNGRLWTRGAAVAPPVATAPRAVASHRHTASSAARR